jgi:precorrin-3B C17-methyltransferase
MNGKIFVIGLGPGKNEFMSIKAIDAIKKSEIIVGYITYIKLIEDLIGGKKTVSSGMRKEVERCKEALNFAEKGKTVALVSSGDAGIYGMAGIMLEVIGENKSDIEVEIIPGITSASSSAAVLGAPLMHDFAVISLSDLMTDWNVIRTRIDCAAKADFVIAIYNPKSSERKTNIVDAREIILKYRLPETPVGIVKDCGRDNEKATVTTLENMLDYDIDMTTTLIVGNSNTYVANGKIITPRGYAKEGVCYKL